MTTAEVIENINGLIHLQGENTNPTGHVGICLQTMAVIKDFEIAKDSNAAEKLYSHPFYNYFQQASNDIHTQYPLRKMAVLEALNGYKRYLTNSEKGRRASTH
ncbi:MAG: hypothetical protein ACPGJS_07710 [Flammeovirgaceae bacterium]